MKKTQLADRTGDWWEDTGYRTMAETKDEAVARTACGFKLQALADELQPAIARTRSVVADLGRSTSALASQLYRRHHPVSDIRMLALCVAGLFLVVTFIAAFAASSVGNILTLVNFGWNLATCVLVGLIGTALVTAIGERAHAKLLAKHPVLDTVVVVIMAGLTVWALVDFGRGRGVMTQLIHQDRQAESYVDATSSSQGADSQEAGASDGSEDGLRGLFSDALTKLTIVADIAVGLLLGALISLLTDDDFAGWRTLRKEKHHLSGTQHQLDRLVAVIEMAKKRCAAGIVRARHHGTSKHPPYLSTLIALALLAGVGSVPHAQEGVRASREEVILLDVSGSISHKAQSRNLFDDLLQGVRQLLRTEPPESRTWTLLISTDSFGGVQTLVRGWTPGGSGIFVDRLNQARRQLVGDFDRRAAGLTPSAAGTDIFGAIARARALMDAEPGSDRNAKDLYLFTDGVNETSFNMPALLPTGVDNMISVAKANKLIVPLPGVRVFVFGAATANLTPDSWAIIKGFWSAYFKAAGAELMAYSPEASPFRK